MAQVESTVHPKGNPVKIPEPSGGDWWWLLGPLARGGRDAAAVCGNASELGDVDERPGKSFLFFVS